MNKHMTLGAIAALTMITTGCQPTAEAKPAEPLEPVAAPQADEKKAPIPELSVAQASVLHAANDAVFLDANSDRTREDRGFVPGATLLSSSSGYDLEKELPTDKAAKLVFYCGSEYCSASDSAAERARDAGYDDVCVMRPGIKGWLAAGKPVEKQKPAS